MVTHDDTRLLLLEEVDEAAEREVEQIVGGKHHHIVVDALLVESQEQVAHCPESRFVGRCPVVDDDNRLGAGLLHSLRGPITKYLGKLMIGHQNVFIDVVDAVEVVEHTVEDGTLPDRQQRLRKVLGERIKARGISCCNDYVFHSCVVLILQKGANYMKSTPSAGSQKKISKLLRYCGYSAR